MEQNLTYRDSTVKFKYNPDYSVTHEEEPPFRRSFCEARGRDNFLLVVRDRHVFIRALDFISKVHGQRGLFNATQSDIVQLKDFFQKNTLGELTYTTDIDKSQEAFLISLSPIQFTLLNTVSESIGLSENLKSTLSLPGIYRKRPSWGLDLASQAEGDRIARLATEYSDALLAEFLSDENLADRARQLAGMGLLKHEYCHLEQYLSIFLDDEGRFIDLWDLNQQINKRFSSKSGDGPKRQSDKVYGELRILSEIVAMVEEMKIETGEEIEANVPALLLHFSRFFEKFGLTTLYDSGDFQSFVNELDEPADDRDVYYSALLILLTKRLDLLAVPTSGALDTKELGKSCLDSLETILDSSQAFVDEVVSLIEEPTKEMLKLKFNQYYQTYRATNN